MTTNKDALDWERDLDILKINIENLPQAAGLTADEIAVLMTRICRLKVFIRQALQTRAELVEALKFVEETSRTMDMLSKDNLAKACQIEIRCRKALARAEKGE